MTLFEWRANILYKQLLYGGDRRTWKCCDWVFVCYSNFIWNVRVWNCDVQIVCVCVCVCRTQAFISVWLMTLMSTCSLCGTGRRNQKSLRLRYVHPSLINLVLLSQLSPLPSSFIISLPLLLSFRCLCPYLFSSFSFLLSNFNRVSDDFLLVLLCCASTSLFVSHLFVLHVMILPMYCFY